MVLLPFGKGLGAVVRVISSKVRVGSGQHRVDQHQHLSSLLNVLSPFQNMGHLLLVHLKLFAYCKKCALRQAIALPVTNQV